MLAFASVSPGDILLPVASISNYAILNFPFVDNWSVKAKRRKTTGTGRTRYLKIVQRVFKNGLKNSSAVRKARKPVTSGGDK